MTARPDRPRQVQGLADRRRGRGRASAPGIGRGRRTRAWSTVPVADGGDGTVDAAVAAGFRGSPSPSPDRPASRSRRPMRAAATTAVVELADVSGLWPAARRRRRAARPRPAAALGEVIAAALDAGCTRLVLGIGGSASTDGGAGMVAALGARLLDADGRRLPRRRGRAGAASPGSTWPACTAGSTASRVVRGLRRRQPAARRRAAPPRSTARRRARRRTSRAAGRPRLRALGGRGRARRTGRDRPATSRGPAPPAGSASPRSPCWAPPSGPASTWCWSCVGFDGTLAGRPTWSSPARARWTSRPCTARRRPGSPRPRPRPRGTGGRGLRPQPARRRTVARGRASPPPTRSPTSSPTRSGASTRPAAAVERLAEDASAARLITDRPETGWRADDVSDYDLVIRARRAVCPTATRRGRRRAGRQDRRRDRCVRRGARRRPVVELAGDEVLLPGLVDTHVHVNEPGRTEWEGFADRHPGGRRRRRHHHRRHAAQQPPADRRRRARWRSSARPPPGSACVDVGFWGGAMPGNLEDLRPLHEAGVFGFKCFLLALRRRRVPAADARRAATRRCARSPPSTGC